MEESVNYPKWYTQQTSQSVRQRRENLVLSYYTWLWEQGQRPENGQWFHVYDTDGTIFWANMTPGNRIEIADKPPKDGNIHPGSKGAYDNEYPKDILPPMIVTGKH